MSAKLNGIVRSKVFYLPTFAHICYSVGGVKVSIVAFQAIDPGSIPG